MLGCGFDFRSTSAVMTSHRQATSTSRDMHTAYAIASAQAEALAAIS
jgi:hypothetical protein